MTQDNGYARFESGGQFDVFSQSQLPGELLSLFVIYNRLVVNFKTSQGKINQKMRFFEAINKLCEKYLQTLSKHAYFPPVNKISNINIAHFKVITSLSGTWNIDNTPSGIIRVITVWKLLHEAQYRHRCQLVDGFLIELGHIHNEMLVEMCNHPFWEIWKKEAKAS
ncbi:MAG: hypothetical protein WCJ59_02620 [bacterium]